MGTITTKQENDFRLEQGGQILQSLPEEVKASLGAGSGKIKFINLLGNPFKTQGIVGKGGEVTDKDTPVTIGALFEAVENVKVPVVTPSKKFTDSLTNDDLTWREVKAGEKFALTLIESYILAIQPEYSMFFGAEGANGEFDDKGCKVTPRWPSATAAGGKSAAAKLPTPTFSVASGRILRKDVIAVCTGTKEAVTWVDPMYEKFAALICKAPKERTQGGTSANSRAAKIEDAKKTALYCRQLLESAMGSSKQ